MDKHYQASLYEDKIYQLWERNHGFNPDYAEQKNSFSSQQKNNRQKTRKPAKNNFCIIMPPPNANDPLHVGHAMFVTLEDIMIRYHRMLDDHTLWLPGTDHAGIETQYVFEKKLKKQGKSRFQYDRNTLYQMIWDYVQENSGIAIKQIKKLGASADWSRFKFTLDQDIVASVLNTFIKLNHDKLIYRANKLVNYCPKCGTAFSNLEVLHREQTSKLYYLKYGPFVLATTRPETKFADTALAVHPQDKRYQKYIGQEIEAEGLLGKFKLKVITDEYVDPEFGTGVVKITPYHDFNDWEVWQRLCQANKKTKTKKIDLPKPKQVIDYHGRLTAVAGKYQGLKVLIAREKIVADLKEKNLLVKVNENYHNTIGCCYRCGQIIEPLPLPQFYIKIKPLVKPILSALKKKEVTIYGAGYEKILKHWLEILEDWNISRQIVWGIRMPVWYSILKNPDIQVTYLDQNGQKITGQMAELLNINKKPTSTAQTKPGNQPSSQNIKFELTGSAQKKLAMIKKGLQSLTAPANASYQLAKSSPGEEFIQETDTFDTWFSSSQWPFITLQNNQKNDFSQFYPTTVMETAYDILMFWVMRMLIMGHYATGQLPFKNIYLHGLIRDAQGRKMSKSKGNVVNPLAIAEEYGTDALRMALVIRSTAGLDKSVGIADFKAARNLTNKLWNASRFVLSFQQSLPQKQPVKITQVQAKNQEIFAKKLKQITKQITQQLNTYKIGLAADTLYQEFWHWYCDQEIEKSKKTQLPQQCLLDGLIVFLKLFHPYLPFVTEVIWQELLKNHLVTEKLLINTRWPS